MQLPPVQVTRAVIQRYARLIQRYDSELGDRPLVLPNASFFPDVFAPDDASAAKLLHRMQVHAGMADIPLVPSVVPRQGTPEKSSGCGSGACGVPETGSGVPRLVDDGNRWRLQIPEAELSHPVALTTNLARSLAFVFLVETQSEGEILEPPVDITADLIAVALGFGPLMLQGSYMYAKSCGGPSIASVTKLSVGEVAIATALFAGRRSLSIRPALKELDTTQRALLAEADALISSNRSVVQLLGTAPGEIAAGRFELHEAKGWLSRLMSKKPTPAPALDLASLDASVPLEELESMLIDMPPASSAGRASSPPRPSNEAQEELKALVADSLKQLHAEA